MAFLALPPHVVGPTDAGIRRVVEGLGEQGYRGVVTSALRPVETGAFERTGFTERERLIVLSRRLRDLPDGNGAARLRKARASDRDDVLVVDHAAFEPAWRLDHEGLLEARRATPRARFRVGTDSAVCAYAISGRAGTEGYLQRLAVHPSRARRGFGTALVVDAMTWLQRRGAGRVVVNTQESNAAALALYRRLGFDREASGLIVMELRFT